MENLDGTERNDRDTPAIDPYVVREWDSEEFTRALAARPASEKPEG